MKGIDKLRVWRAGRTISNFGIYVIWCNNISWIWNTVTEKATASYHWGLNYPSAETNVTHDFKKARIDVFILYSHVSFFSRDVFTIQTSLCCFCCAFSAGRVSLCLTDFVLFWSIRSVSSHINSLRTHHTPYSETAHSCHHSNSTNSRRKHCEPLGPQAKTWGTPIAWETQKTALSPQRERRTLTEVFCPPPFNYNSVCSAVLPLTLYAAQPQS